MTNMNANPMIGKMIDIENKQLDPDERRCIRDARMRVQATVNTPTPDPASIRAAMDHAREVAESWGHKL